MCVCGGGGGGGGCFYDFIDNNIIKFFILIRDKFGRIS